MSTDPRTVRLSERWGRHVRQFESLSLRAARKAAPHTLNTPLFQSAFNRPLRAYQPRSELIDDSRRDLDLPCLNEVVDVAPDLSRVPKRGWSDAVSPDVVPIGGLYLNDRHHAGRVVHENINTSTLVLPLTRRFEREGIRRHVSPSGTLLGLELSTAVRGRLKSSAVGHRHWVSTFDTGRTLPGFDRCIATRCHRASPDHWAVMFRGATAPLRSGLFRRRPSA